ncbi:endonuclease domain-containing 1 protein-like [Pelobates fuscus]|uniref:endonuclease domain-containing 1 protein-like n=1 Tax=Pelobates fuscus TaxID=191477 RepID=UPI002FE46928
MMFWLLLGLALVNTALAKVSTNFDDCRGHFYASTPPQGFENVFNQNGVITHLCLMLENQNNPFYASLYHKELRYPLYAAYILDIRPDDPKSSSKTFRLEPQLVDPSLPDHMMSQPELQTSIRKKRLPGQPADLIKQVQAINSDYSNPDYHKGHLNPNADHPAGPGQEATYTLANVAPMYGSLNCGQWRTNEERVRNIAKKCAKMYVVTGVVPGSEWIPVKGVQQRVNIPSHIWSAFCCLGNNNQPIAAEGSLVVNNASGVPTRHSISNLQTELFNLLHVSVTLFNNSCS